MSEIKKCRDSMHAAGSHAVATTIEGADQLEFELLNSLSHGKFEPMWAWINQLGHNLSTTDGRWNRHERLTRGKLTGSLNHLIRRKCIYRRQHRGFSRVAITDAGFERLKQLMSKFACSVESTA